MAVAEGDKELTEAVNHKNVTTHCKLQCHAEYTKTWQISPYNDEPDNCPDINWILVYSDCPLRKHCYVLALTLLLFLLEIKLVSQSNYRKAYEKMVSSVLLFLTTKLVRMEGKLKQGEEMSAINANCMRMRLKMFTMKSALNYREERF